MFANLKALKIAVLLLRVFIPDQPTSIYTKKSGCYFRRIHLKPLAHSEQECAQRTQNTVRQLAEFKNLNTTR